jgi:hypothetical protein
LRCDKPRLLQIVEELSILDLYRRELLSKLRLFLYLILVHFPHRRLRSLPIQFDVVLDVILDPALKLENISGLQVAQNSILLIHKDFLHRLLLGRRLNLLLGLQRQKYI